MPLIMACRPYRLAMVQGAKQIGINIGPLLYFNTRVGLTLLILMKGKGIHRKYLWQTIKDKELSIRRF
jgi:hypothetical protein